MFKNVVLLACALFMLPTMAAPLVTDYQCPSVEEAKLLGLPFEDESPLGGYLFYNLSDYHTKTMWLFGGMAFGECDQDKARDIVHQSLTQLSGSAEHDEGDCVYQQTGDVVFVAINADQLNGGSPQAALQNHLARYTNH